MRYANMALCLFFVSCTTTREAKLPLAEEEIRALNDELRDREVSINATGPRAPVYEGPAAEDGFDDRYNVVGRGLLLDSQTASWSDARTGQKKALPLATLKSLTWLSRGHPRVVGFFQGAALGLIGALPAGLAVAGASQRGCQSYFGGGPDCRRSPSFDPTLGGIGGALAAVLIGGAFGAIVGHHDEIEFTSSR